ncbi:MAG: ROK family transcriptional regulator [Cyanobacteria bacterium SZAS LIN-2]|nr:ROK family transcriptional regulator [Cyanobacteria bacterium SZAS LIN-2]
MASPSFLEMRSRNVVRILQAVRQQPGLSRAEVSRCCDLAKSTVSVIVDELVESTILQEIGSRESFRGRRPVGLIFNPSSRIVAGISLDHSRTEFVICDLDATVLAVRTKKHARRSSLQYSASTLLSELQRLLIEKKIDWTSVCGIGLAAPGPLSSGYVVTESGENLDYELFRTKLARECNCPVVVDSNTNMAALAESRTGAARDSEEALVIRLGHEVRSTLIIDHKQLKGAQGRAGELGHVSVPGLDERCRCGRRGCINAVASVDAVISLCRQQGTAVQDIEEVISAALRGDKKCQKVLSEAGRAVGFGIASCINVLAPPDVIVTGRLIAAGNILLTPLHEAIEKYAVAESLRSCNLIFDDSQNHIEAIGASLAVLLQDDFLGHLVSSPASNLSIS